MVVPIMGPASTPLQQKKEKRKTTPKWRRLLRSESSSEKDEVLTIVDSQPRPPRRPTIDKSTISSPIIHGWNALRNRSEQNRAHRTPRPLPIAPPSTPTEYTQDKQGGRLRANSIDLIDLYSRIEETTRFGPADQHQSPSFSPRSPYSSGPAPDLPLPPLPTVAFLYKGTPPITIRPLTSSKCLPLKARQKNPLAGSVEEKSCQERKQSTTPNLMRQKDSMETSHLQPPNAGTKARAVQQAKEMQAIVLDRARRNGDEPPPYDFHELIGKGAYGRVFKGLNRANKGLVAIKIIDIDRVDYEEMTSKNLQDTLQEIKILQQVKDSRARDYVNIIEEARTVHNELWIISEYASGGSVNTLMKPYVFLSNRGLEEKYIIPIARELAQGLKYIHEAGVIHRDLKCNNILVNEQGRVQLCDFGVSGALEPEIAKRSTIVGTPFWMAPELHQEWVKEADPRSMVRPNQILYGSEVDIWAYGCTLFEMATGFPPFHTTKPFDLQQAGVPKLEGPDFSDTLKDLISYVLQPDAQDRPTASQILEQPYIFDTDKMFPTFTLIQLVENYYRWEQGGGSRASLFNPFGAQAPDPLAPESESGEDWNFSTSEEFEKQHSGDPLGDPFTGGSQNEPFAGINAPPVDDSRFAQLQAQYRREAADRGGKRLNRLFDQNSTPYRYSAIDPEPGPGRPPSDLVLRDFDTGAPNRETVIDLDIALPTVDDVPNIDLGEVPTLRANRNRMTRDSIGMEDEETDVFDMDQTMRRSTRDSNRFAEQLNRRTMDWKMPGFTEQPNRRTMEWTFNASMAEANQEPLPKPARLSRRRDTAELTLPLMTAPAAENRYTKDFVFPPRDPTDSHTLPDQGQFASSPTLDSGFDDYPRISSAPESPLRASMIDLDMAVVDRYRPSTSGSESTSTFTAGTENLNGNPFDLEDQVNLSQTNNRASYHMKSQSEPNQAIPGLLTPQTYDEQGYPINQDPHHPSMHARGVSSVSQMQAKQPGNNVAYGRQRSYQPAWDAWNHHAAYSIDESPPASIATSTSTEEDYDEMWDAYERRVLQTQQSRRRQASGFQSRRTASQDDDLRSDTDDNYASEYDDLPARQSRVSVGPNGRPLVDFPVPRGPEPETLLGIDNDPNLMMNALWKSTIEMRDGLRSSIDLLKSMHLQETTGIPPGPESDDSGDNTVRLGKPVPL